MDRVSIRLHHSIPARVGIVTLKLAASVENHTQEAAFAKVIRDEEVLRSLDECFLL